MKYKKLQREKNYNPLTVKTIGNGHAINEMVARINAIQPGERVTYYSGVTPWHQAKHTAEALALRQLLDGCVPKLDDRKREVHAPEKPLIFLSENLGALAGFDYIVVGK